MVSTTSYITGRSKVAIYKMIFLSAPFPEKRNLLLKMFTGCFYFLQKRDKKRELGSKVVTRDKIKVGDCSVMCASVQKGEKTMLTGFKS